MSLVSATAISFSPAAAVTLSMAEKKNKNDEKRANFWQVKIIEWNQRRELFHARRESKRKQEEEDSLRSSAPAIIADCSFRGRDNQSRVVCLCATLFQSCSSQSASKRSKKVSKRSSLGPGYFLTHSSIVNEWVNRKENFARGSQFSAPLKTFTSLWICEFLMWGANWKRQARPNRPAHFVKG